MEYFSGFIREGPPAINFPGLFMDWTTRFYEMTFSKHLLHFEKFKMSFEKHLLHFEKY